MNVTNEASARGGLIVILGVGAAFLSLHTFHAVGEGEDLRTLLLGILIPAGFALGILAGGIWLHRSGFDDAYIPRAAVWCVGGAVALAVMAVLTILYQHAEGVTVSDQLFVVVNAASGGGLVGLVVGVYETRQHTARAEVDQLTRHLTVLNRVLRHDIRNNANVIQGNAELLADCPTDPGERARIIKRQAADLVELGEHAKEIERLLHADDAEREVVGLAAQVEACCEQLSREYPGADIDASLPDDLPVLAHPLVSSALLNLIENAIEHNDTSTPRVEIDSTTTARGGAEFATVRIADDGPGIPDSELAALERGYETDLEHMSGLGLWLVNWIAIESGGDVWFEENDPTGTVACLRLPRAPAATAATPAVGRASAARR
ncbi:ATP-binding protein [Halobellus ruber]|uniref:histidine kinase n=1 Tax=Halobellus ruber TaxID=2761102 RepID=A0A7J9SQ77_9EURY|nr:ATP-binding protein [Halobellus ruber]MBB6647881.1 hypothetical protein [Halobellus ruber]